MYVYSFFFVSTEERSNTESHRMGKKGRRERERRKRGKVEVVKVEFRDCP